MCIYKKPTIAGGLFVQGDLLALDRATDQVLGFFASTILVRRGKFVKKLKLFEF